jgi:hypothetical protein
VIGLRRSVSIIGKGAKERYWGKQVFDKWRGADNGGKRATLLPAQLMRLGNP